MGKCVGTTSGLFFSISLNLSSKLRISWLRLLFYCGGSCFAMTESLYLCHSQKIHHHQYRWLFVFWQDFQGFGIALGQILGSSGSPLQIHGCQGWTKAASATAQQPLVVSLGTVPSMCFRNSPLVLTPHNFGSTQGIRALTWLLWSSYRLRPGSPVSLLS